MVVLCKEDLKSYKLVKNRLRQERKGLSENLRDGTLIIKRKRRKLKEWTQTIQCTTLKVINPKIVIVHKVN